MDRRRHRFSYLHIVSLGDGDHAAPVFLSCECLYMTDQAAVIFDFGGCFAHGVFQRVHSFSVFTGNDTAHGSDHSLLMGGHLQRRDAVVMLMIMVIMVMMVMVVMVMVVMIMVVMPVIVMAMLMMIVLIVPMLMAAVLIVVVPVMPAFAFHFCFVLYSVVFHDI